ncbi:MAG: DnaD domain protein [Dehalococcoidia bacterium]|jgi:DnaD/phage-associated family protein
MEQFKGFPAKSQFTAVPNAFFSRLLPQISDIAELKVTLHIFQTLYQKRGYPRFTSYPELLSNQGLMSSLKDEEALAKALEMATKRGTIMHLALDRDGQLEDIYLVNDDPGRRTMARIESGALKLEGLEMKEPALVDEEAPPDIFSLYEQNIGTLTPLIAEELRDALENYPESWIRDAIKEAVNQNIRKKSYILAILESWKTEGRDDGTYRGDSKKTGPDKYIKGKYGNIVQR